MDDRSAALPGCSRRAAGLPPSPNCEDRPLEHIDGVRRVRVGGKALVDRALERDHVEAHLLVKELDQANLRRIELADAMTAFAKLHQAALADHVFEEPEVGEVVLWRGHDRCDGEMIRARPCDPGGSIVLRKDRARQRGDQEHRNRETLHTCPRQLSYSNHG